MKTLIHSNFVCKSLVSFRELVFTIKYKVWLEVLFFAEFYNATSLVNILISAQMFDVYAQPISPSLLDIACKQLKSKLN